VFTGLLGVQKKGQKKLAERTYEERTAAEQGNGHRRGIKFYGRGNAEGIGQGQHDAAEAAVGQAVNQGLPDEGRPDVHAAYGLSGFNHR
jgi:hypothetical protein